MEGDTIERNGVSLTVPEGCYYMFGDNADNSYDSRYWDEPFVSEEDVITNPGSCGATFQASVDAETVCDLLDGDSACIFGVHAVQRLLDVIGPGRRLLQEFAE